jgi:hypothetical protein
MTSQRPDFRYQAAEMPADEDPTYAWAAERLVAGSRRLADVFSLVRSIQRQAAGKSVTGTAVMDPMTGQFKPSFEWPSICTKDERVELGVRASETLHHVRAALEYFAYADAWKEKGEPASSTAFPICTSKEEWSEKGTRRRLSLLSHAAAGAIEAVQPFNGVLWTLRLRELSNLDRHRRAIVLAPTVNWTCPRDFASLVETALPTQVTVNATVGGDVGAPFQDEAEQIFDGVVAFLNPFLVSEGHVPMELKWSP